VLASVKNADQLGLSEISDRHHKPQR
jgi:hypothetical protein